MTHKEVLDFGQTLQRVSHIRGKQFAYAVFKNKSIVEQEKESILKFLQKEPHPNFHNYENERTIICITYSEKDENGNAKTIEGPQGKQYVIADYDSFNKELAELQNKYPEVIQDIEQNRRDVDEFMNSESSISLVKVTINDLPDDIDANLIEALKHMIE